MKRSRESLKLLLIAIGVLAFCRILSGNILFLNLSSSLPRGLYLAVPGNTFRLGDTVAYRPTDEVMAFCMDREYLEKEKLFVKKIAALEGDLYEVNEENRFMVRNSYLGQAIPKDLSYRSMPIKYGKHIVPIGEFLPYTPAARSLDGRYTGTVPLERIITRVVPILTEW